MIASLMGVPGKLKTLLDRLTSTRAGYLDNLSGGAPATAANYTATRAGYLDKLNSGGVPIVKLYQTGYVAVGASSGGAGEDYAYINVTVSSVNTAKCLVLVTGTDSTIGVPLLMGRLTSSTNLRLSLWNGAGNINGRWQLVEFY